LWQLAQLCVNTAAPSGDWADERAATSISTASRVAWALVRVMAAKCTPAAEPATLNLQPPL
jgi:hypothetical protein